jgi:N-acetylglucosamine-6-sulfatase
MKVSFSRRVATVTAAVLGVLLPGPPHAIAVVDAPNIVVIMVDDMRLDALADMPNTQRLLVDQGVEFSNFYVSNALCCPSRVSFGTGNYSHTTGVYSNGDSATDAWGGNAAYFSHGNDPTTLVNALNPTYRTALVGKWLNGYDAVSPQPTGWDRWVAFSGMRGGGGAYYEYDLNVDGAINHFGSRTADYSTDVLRDYALDFIATTDGGDEPFYLYFAPYASHGPSTPARRHQGMTFPYNKQPGFNERDVSDKPAYIGRLPAPGRDQRVRWNLQVASLQAVDEAVEAFVNSAPPNTVYVFTSDNGKYLAEHRLIGKEAPYEQAIHLPLVIRAPDLEPRSEDGMVANIDLAPTLAGFAGVAFGPTDGIDARPLIKFGDTVRTELLLEHIRDQGEVPTYCGLVTDDGRKLIEYANGEREFYNLSLDPWELHSRPYAPSVQKLRDKLRVTCSPLPPGMAGF